MEKFSVVDVRREDIWNCFASSDDEMPVYGIVRKLTDDEMERIADAMSELILDEKYGDSLETAVGIVKGQLWIKRVKMESEEIQSYQFEDSEDTQPEGGDEP